MGTDENDKFVASWNRGNLVDVSAPGKGIWHVGDTYSTYLDLDGTSMSAPQVSGLAALILSLNSNHTRDSVAKFLAQSADKVDTFSYGINSQHPWSTWNERLGYGRINAYKALSMANGAPASPQNLTWGVSGYAPQISWSANTEPDLASYRLYRRSISAPNWVLHATLPAGTTSFTETDALVDPNNPSDSIYYYVKAVDVVGNASNPSNTIVIPIHFISDSGKRSVRTTNLPTAFDLSQAYPNPFNPSTVISYALPADVHVTLKVFDMLGREVALLVDDMKAAGYYDVVFEASALASGTYIYRLQAGDFGATRKLLLLR